MKIKNVLVLIALQLMALSSFADVSCSKVMGSGMTIRKANYLAMDRYGKLNLLMNQFDLTPRDQKVVKYDNLLVSESFRLVGKKPDSISDKAATAAMKAMKQYELDKYDNGRILVATVLFEKDASIPGGENVWAVLLSRRQVTTSGKEVLSPVSIYSIERNSQGEIIVAVSHGFDGMPL